VAEKDLSDLQHADLQHASAKTRKELKIQSVIRSAMAMALGTFSSRILGFVRDAVMFAVFPRGVTDAFVVAFRLPNMFRRLLGEGSLSVSFIPIYVEARRESSERAVKLSDAVFSVVLTVSTIISLICFVYMEPILNYLVGDPQGFAAVPGKLEQTIALARIMIFYLILVSTYAFHMAIANTLGKFFIPAMGPALFNVGLIVFTIMPWELGSYRGSSQAWGVIAGGVMQAGLVAWLLVKQGVLPRLSLRWKNPDVLHVFRNMAPGLFGLGVFQVMTIVNTKFAARLAEGAQSYIYAADRVLELPQSIIAVSLGAALLPRFSELHTSGQKEAFLREANDAVCMLLYLSLPAAVGMLTLSLPITQVLFMRGAFTFADAQQTALIVAIYSGLLLCSSLARVTAPAFYAIQKPMLPAIVAFGVLCVHISVGSWVVNVYGLPGLALATSISSFVNLVALQILFHVWLGPLGLMRIAGNVLRLSPALLVMGVFCFYAYPWLESEVGLRTVALGVTIALAMGLYFALTIVTGSPMADKFWRRIKSRLSRASSKTL